MCVCVEIARHFVDKFSVAEQVYNHTHLLQV